MDYRSLSFKQKHGFLGILLLIIGVFSPLVSIPLIGSYSYFNNGRGDGILILGICAISSIFLHYKKNGRLLIASLSSFVIITYDFLKLRAVVEGGQETGLAQIIGQNMIRVEYGWMFLFAGSLLLIYTTFLKD